MNKKVNTAVFLLVATVVNVLIMVVIILGLWLLVQVIAAKNQGLASVLFVVSLFVGIAATFFIYTLIVKLFQKKVDMDKYFHPIFRPRGGRKGPPPS